jgi:hypothetical protein
LGRFCLTESRFAWEYTRSEKTETPTGYFCRILRENPKLLKGRSNDELISRWRADHPGQEFTGRIRAGLMNAKSALRHKKRKRKGNQRAEQPQEEAVATHELPRPVNRPRHLEALEEQIDECLGMAKHLDREGLGSIITLLRRARNEVVWKMGQ